MYLADTLSRATLPTTNDVKQTNFEVFRIDIDNNIMNDGITPNTLTSLTEDTMSDAMMGELTKIITQGWPALKSQLPPGLSPYWTYRDELTVMDGLVYKGTQVVIPANRRKYMLDRIHAAHLGPESNIRMCKDILFWPGMQAEIRDICLACGKCAQYKNQNPKEPMKSQPIPEYPWQFVSQDICTFNNDNYLVTVDHYSDFIEVDELDNTLGSTVRNKTEAHIARYGAPEITLTDNGPQFISSEYKTMCNGYGTQHITSSPYWPQGNGKAEASVKILKRILQKAGKGNMHEALLNYRNTPP